MFLSFIIWYSCIGLLFFALLVKHFEVWISITQILSIDAALSNIEDEEAQNIVKEEYKKAGMNTESPFVCIGALVFIIGWLVFFPIAFMLMFLYIKLGK